MSSCRPGSAVSNKSTREGLVASVRRRLARDREAVDQASNPKQIDSEDITQRLIDAELLGSYVRLIRGNDEATLVVDKRALLSQDADLSNVSEDIADNELPIAVFVEIVSLSAEEVANSLSALSVLSALSFAGIWPNEASRIQWCQLDFERLAQSSAMLRLDLGSHRHSLKPFRKGLQPCLIRKNYPRKGTCNRFQLTVKPYNDAEIFQLIYIKLVLKQLFNYHIRGMFDERSDVISHNIGYVPSTAALCFEGPQGTLLLFPGKVNLLVPLPVETLQRDVDDGPKLIVGLRGVPCTTQLGCRAVTWAQKRLVTSPADAGVALGELFTLFSKDYRSTAEAVLSMSTEAKIFRSTERAQRRLMRACPVVGALLLDRAVGEEKKKQVVPALSVTHAIDEKWKSYLATKNANVFNGDIRNSVEIERELGKGGSGLVFKGKWLQTAKPVAIKCFVQVDGMSHEEYVRECLTDLAFLAIGNQLAELNVASAVRAYDFVVSAELPLGMTQAQVKHCYHNSREVMPRMCFLITDLADATIGRFLNENDDDYDPCYDTLLNVPFTFGEVFQLLYTQLVFRAFADYTVHDLMLNGQLRGDNIGSVSVDATKFDALSYEGPSGERISFPVQSSPSGQNLRLIYFIDVGQGLQPQVQRLSKDGLIGQSVVESCVVDDGMGRYWPPDRLYAQNVDVADSEAKLLRDWGAEQIVKSAPDAMTALTNLFAFCISCRPQQEKIPARALSFSCGAEVARRFRETFVYRDL